MTIKYNRKLINFNELNEKKKFFDNLMKNDYSILNQNFKDYLYHLKDIKLKEHIEGEKKQQIHDKYNYLYNFSPERIKFLSYKEEDLYSKRPIKKEEPKIDIIKLMRYTKRGNKKWFQEELKKKSANRLSAIQLRSKSINKIHNKNNINELLENEKGNNDENIIIDFSSYKPNTFSNFKNSIKTVKNEAEKAYFLQENFDKKIDTMDELFNNKILPNIEDYDYLIQKNVKKKPRIRKNVDIEKTNEEEGEKIIIK